jgi:hypothetical protein
VTGTKHWDIVGLAMAKEVLIWGKKKDADQLLVSGFIK